MITIIAGSRSITDKWIIDEGMKLVPWEITAVVSGCARGVDILGEGWARERMIPVKRMPAEWSKYRGSAGPIRNKAMAECSQALVAFWDGVSRGTQHMITTAKSHGLAVVVIQIVDGVPVITDQALDPEEETL